MLSTCLPSTLFARRMKIARQRLGISQMELGVRAGIDESSASARINQYERGKHMPDFLTVCNLAKVLNVPAAYFYTEEEQLAELIVIFGQLQTLERKALLDGAAGLLETPKLSGDERAARSRPFTAKPVLTEW